MGKNVKGGFLILVGILAVILALVCFNKDSGSFMKSFSYGGDAYTGIQNACAKTANNVNDLADIVKFGFGSCLLVAGLSLIVVGLPVTNKNESNDAVVKDTKVVTSTVNDVTLVASDTNGPAVEPESINDKE